MTLRLHELSSFRDLWRRLEAALPGRLPPRARARLVYRDGAGDWVLVTPDHRWSAFVAAAFKVTVHAAPVA